MYKYILLNIFLMTASVLFAQDFEVSPLKLPFNAEPGESQTKFVFVKNHKSSTETFILSLKDLSVNNKGEGSYVDAGSMKNSVANLISIAPSFFELGPNEEKEISVTFQQPADENSSKWGVIFVRTAQEQTAFSADKGISTGMNLSAQIAIEVTCTPGTNRSYKATITNLSELSVISDSTRTFNAVVNNLGDVITSCKVYMIATNLQTAEETTFDEKNFPMYPKSSRKIVLEMPQILPKGKYSLAAILDYGSRTNLEGTQLIIDVE